MPLDIRRYQSYVNRSRLHFESENASHCNINFQ
jgi:hypothetical protein